MSTLTAIPGSPDAIDRHVAEMATVADAMARAAIQLRKLHDGTSFKSQAVDKIDTNADEVATDLDDAATRYTTTAAALSTYSRVLRTAQQTVEQANQGAASLDIPQALATVKQLKQQVQDASLNSATSPTDLAHLQAQLNQAKQYLSQQHLAIAHYAQMTADANNDVDTAAKYAIAQIHAAKEASKLNNNPGTWLNNAYAHAKKFYADHVHVYVEILMTALSELSNILAVAGVIIAMIPVVGWAIGGVLEGASKVVGATALALEVIEFVFGQASFTDLLIAGIGVAVGFMAGKLIGKTMLGLGKMAKSGKLGMGIKTLLSKESHKAGGLTQRFNHLVRGTNAHPKTVFGIRVKKASVQGLIKHRVAEGEHKIAKAVDRGVTQLTINALKGQPPSFHRPTISVPHQIPRLHVSVQQVEGVLSDLYE